MSQTPHPSDAELLARLRIADPAAELPAADPDAVDHLLHRVVDADLRETGTRRRNPLTWLVAAAAVVVIAAGAAWWLRGDGSTSGVVAGPGTSGGTAAAPATTELAAAPAAGGRCLVPTAEMLAAKPVAFAGTVLGIADGVATIRPTKVFAGDVGDEVSVKGAVAPDAGGIEGDPEFVTGQDYLVAADGGRVLGCGLSGPADDPQTQDLYARAFPR